MICGLLFDNLFTKKKWKEVLMEVLCVFFCCNDLVIGKKNLPAAHAYVRLQYYLCPYELCERDHQLRHHQHDDACYPCVAVRTICY